MGSILQIFDLNRTNLSRKLSAHRRHVEGPETPRNSLEFPIEAPQSSIVIHDDIPYSCQVRRSSKTNIFPNGTIIKNLIGEDMSKRTNDKRNAPSVVARLMGMDNLPSEVKPTIFPKEWKDGNPRSKLPRNMSSSHLARTSTSTNSFRPTKPQLREHPQEELLQKFKKEFEEWQASRAWEHSSNFEVENYHGEMNVNRFLAQENLNKEKIARYSDPKNCLSTIKEKLSEQKVFSQYEGHTSKQFDEKQDISSSTSSLQHEGHTSRYLDTTKSEKKQDRSSTSTRIVILKPGSEREDAFEENLCHSPEILEKETSMKDFLEEVKERLKSEMIGKAGNNTKAREIITEASFGERSPDTKQFARYIAKKIRDSVARELRSTFVRSESTRLYRSEVQSEHPESPKLSKREARRFLLLTNETGVEVPQAINESTRMKKERSKSGSIHDFSKLAMNYLEDTKSLNESKATFIGRQVKGDVLDAEPVSPRNLVRSFSAPLSGTAFRRLRLEDQDVSKGVHISQKHGVSELPSQELKKKRKDSFNLKGTVSNFRQNFIRKGKLFGKKTQLVDEFEEPFESEDPFSSLRPIVTAPSVVEKFGVVLDNSTEVPPSPASLTDSSQDDFFRLGIPSPISPLQACPIEDQRTPKLSTEITSMLSDPCITPFTTEMKELSEQVDHVGGDVLTEQKSFDDGTVEVEGNAERYIREILTAAGLYEVEAFAESFPRGDASTKPIPNWVFDQIEETYNKRAKLDDDESLLCYSNIDLSHRVLFDLVNEALPCALRVAEMTSSSKLKNRVLGHNTMPHGEILLNCLLSHIQGILNFPLNESSSLDNIVAEDVRITPWLNVIHADVNAIGRKMESIILADLINELEQEMFSLVTRIRS